MRRAIATMIVCFAAASAFAQTNDTESVTDRETRIRATAERRQFLKSDPIVALRQAASAASAAYREAVNELPDIRELDRQIAETRQQLRLLTRQRREAERRSVAAAQERAARDTAVAAYREALKDDPAIKLLLEIRGEQP